MRGYATGAVVVALAAGLLALAGASGPLFVASVGSASLDSEVDGPGQTSAAVVRVGGTPGSELLSETDETLREHITAAGLPEPRASLSVGGVGLGGPLPERGQDPEPDEEAQPGREVNVLAADDGIAALPDPVDQVADAPGDVVVTATEQDAESLGLRAGDTVELHGPHGALAVTVERVVADVPRGEVPGAWEGLGGLLHYSVPPEVDPTYPTPPPPALLIDFAALPDLVDGLDLAEVQQADTREGMAWPRLHLSGAWRVPLPGESLTLEAAREMTAPAEELARVLSDPRDELATVMRWPMHVGENHVMVAEPNVSAPLEDAVERAEQVTASLSGPVSALSLGGQALGLVAVAAAALLGGGQRLKRARLWAARGVSPATLGLRTAALSAPAVVAGAASGWAAAVGIVRWLGPGGPLHADAVGEAVRLVTLASALALALIWLVAAVASASAGRTSGAPRRLPPVAEATAAALAAVAYWQLRERGGALAIAADGQVDLDLLALALPLLLLVAATGLGVRLLRLLLRMGAARGRGSRAPARYLAVRRLRSLPASGAALLTLAATAGGLLVFAGTLSASSEATIDEKTGLLVGADGAARLPRAQASRDALDLDTLPYRRTEVTRAEEALLADRLDVDVLAVDPATFAEVAHVPRGMDADDIDSLLARLEPAGDGPAPVAMAGAGAAAPPEGPARLAIDAHEFEVDVVEEVDAFPGMLADRPLVVIADPDVLTSEDPAEAARLASAVDPYLWLDGVTDSDQLRQAMFETGLERYNQPTLGSVDPSLDVAAELRDDPSLVPLDWTFGYLQGQAVALSALGLLALLAGFLRQHRQRALSVALTAKMGLGAGARTRADALELGCLVASAAVLGGGAGVAAAQAVLGQYDPLPELALPPILSLPGTVLASAVAVAAVAGAAGLAVAARASARADVAELLRRG